MCASDQRFEVKRPVFPDTAAQGKSQDTVEVGQTAPVRLNDKRIADIFRDGYFVFLLEFEGK